MHPATLYADVDTPNNDNHGDYGIMPDLDRFGSAILASFAELVAAAANAPERARPTKGDSKAKKDSASVKGSPKKRPPIGT